MAFHNEHAHTPTQTSITPTLLLLFVIKTNSIHVRYAQPDINYSMQTMSCRQCNSHLFHYNYKNDNNMDLIIFESTFQNTECIKEENTLFRILDHYIVHLLVISTKSTKYR